MVALLLGQVGVGAEEFFGVGGKGDVLGEPEDGEDDALDAGGVGAHVVELVDEGDGAAGGVDEEVGRHGQGGGLAELVVEVVEGGLVDHKVLQGTHDDLAQLGGVDQVVETDDATGVEVEGDIARGVEPMGGKGCGALLTEDEGEEVAVGDDLALELGIVVGTVGGEGVGRVFVEDGEAVLIEPAVAEPLVGSLLEGGGGAVAKGAQEHQTLVVGSEEAVGRPLEGTAVVDPEGVTFGPELLVGGEEEAAMALELLDGGRGVGRLPAGGHGEQECDCKEEEIFFHDWKG